MKRRKLFQEKDILKSKKGITLIALVISIIVMLILAGVSLNATIGDNGIITQAKNTTYMQSIAILEEYFNQYYVENYESLLNEENKIEVIKNQHSEWFYSGSPIGYIVDSDGNMHYFINKDGLPTEIKNQLAGGDAGDKSYRAYASMKDVYGITNNLKVYYCIDSNQIMGNTEFDKDNPERIVFEAGTEFAKLVTGEDEKNVTLDDIKNKKTLVINQEANINSLNELYKFISLTELTINGINMDNLNGIENLNYLTSVTFIDATIKSYDKLNSLNNQINEINFINTTNEQLELFCDDTSNTEYSKLQLLSIFSDLSRSKIEKCYRVNDISCLSNLNEQTKKSIIKLKINDNKITSIENLVDFTNIETLQISNNVITSLKGIELLSNLKVLEASDNKLGTNEIYDDSLQDYGKNKESDSIIALKDKTKLKSLNLSYNKNLKWIGYIKECNALETLYMLGCPNLVIQDLTEIRSVWYNLKNKNINSDKLIAFNSSDVISLAMKNLTDESVEFKSLYNNSSCEKLSLEGNSLLSDNEINNVLSTMSNLKYLSLKGVTNFTNLEFIKENSKLVEIDLRGTSCTDLRNLNNCTDLTNLAVDNIETDFTNIQEIITSMSKKTRKNAYWSNYNKFYPTIECAKNLNNCKNIEYLDIFQWPEKNRNEVLDLSECTGLKTVTGQNTFVKIKYPSSMTLYQVSNNACPDLSEAYNLTSFIDVAISFSQEEFDMLFDDLSECKKLNLVEIHAMNNNINYSLKNISKLKQTPIKILKLFDWSDGNGKRAFNSVEEIGKITSLEELYVENQINLASTKGIENLVNLRVLNFSGSKITNLTGIESLNKLTSLNLNGADLYDTYLDQNTKENKNTLEVIANLNYKKNGNLKNLYMDNNTKITNWDSISKLSWELKSGF